MRPRDLLSRAVLPVLALGLALVAAAAVPIAPLNRSVGATAWQDEQKLGDLALTTGQVDAAGEHFDRALREAEATGARADAIADLLDRLGRVRFFQHRDAAAERLFEKAIELRRATFGPNDPGIARSLEYEADLYGSQGDGEREGRLLGEALALRERALGEDSPEVAHSLVLLAAYEQSRERFTEAEALYRHALAIGEQAFGAESPELGDGLAGLADTLRATGRLQEAEVYSRRFLALVDRRDGS